MPSCVLQENQRFTRELELWLSETVLFVIDRLLKTRNKINNTAIKGNYATFLKSQETGL